MLACSVLLLTVCGPVGDGDDSGTSGSGGAVRDGGTITVALADDPWSHEAEPEPTPDYHQAADAYMAAARADLGAPD